MLKKWISLWLTIVMLLTTLSIPALAQEDAQTAPGTEQTEVVTPAGDAGDTADKPETGDTGSAAGDTGSGSGDAPATGDSTENTAATDPEAEQDGDPLAPEAEPELPTEEAANEQIAAAAAALAALPDEVTWDAFAAVEAAGAALAAVPADLQAQVEGASKLQPAIDALLAIYADALAALDPTADVWENQHAIKTFAEMKAQMDAAQYVKPADDMSLMGDEAADLSWLDAAMLAYADAEACIIPAGGDMSLMDTREATDYDTLQAAINAVKTGETILVKQNLEIEQTISAENGATYTINTNKKKIELISAQLQFKAGTVTVNGGGTIDGTAATSPIEIPYQSDTPVLTLDNITVLSNEDHSQWNPALRVDGGKSLTIQNCKFDGTIALLINDLSKVDSIVIKNTSIRTTGSRQDREAALSFLCNTASRTVQIDNVDIEANEKSAIGFWGRVGHSTNVTIQNSNLQTTNPSGTPILTYENASRDDFDITVSNTQTYPALTDEKCTLADGQFNFTNKETGGSIIMSSLSKALAIAPIELTSDYTQISPLTIAKGQKLYAKNYAIKSGFFTVEGTLEVEGVNVFTSPAIIKDSAIVGTPSKTFIAPRGTAGVAPVFAMHKGAEMMVQIGEENTYMFKATSGEITIENNMGSTDKLNMGDDSTLHISEDATVWLTNSLQYDTSHGSRVLGIYGTVHVIFATDASGKKNYESIQDAVDACSSIKLVRDVTAESENEVSTYINKSITIDMDGHTLYKTAPVFIIKADKNITVTIKNGTLTGHDWESWVTAEGQAGAVATLNMENVDNRYGVKLGNYVKLTIKNCTYNPWKIVEGDADIAQSEVSIIDCGDIWYGIGAGTAIDLPSIKSLYIANTKLCAYNNGISVHSGNVTLDNVTLFAETGTALSAIASNQDDVLTLNIIGGSISAPDGAALTYGYAAGVTSASVSVNISKDTAITGLASITKQGEGAAAQVTGMVAYPTPSDASYAPADGTHAFAVKNSDGTAGVVVCNTLSQAFAMDGVKEVQLLADYANAKESIVVNSGMLLDFTGHNLTLKSLVGYGTLKGTSGNLKAQTLEQHGGSVTLGSAAQLVDGTMLVAMPNQTQNTTEYVHVEVADFKQESYYDVISNSDDSLGSLANNDYARIGIKAKETETDGTVMEVIVLEGDAQIRGKYPGDFDIGKHYLTIMPGARVTVLPILGVVESDHITGTILFPSVTAFLEEMDKLPETLEEITYRHFDIVVSAMAAYFAIPEKHVPAVPVAESNRLSLFATDVAYVIRAIQTMPAEELLVLTGADTGTLEPGGSLSVALQPHSDVPVAITHYLNDPIDALFVPVYDLSVEGDKFSVDANGKVTATGAAVGDETVLSVYYREKNGTRTSNKVDILLRVTESFANATLGEMVLGSYTYTVDKATTGNTVAIPYAFAFDNGLLQNVGFTPVNPTLTDEGKYKLKDVFSLSIGENDTFVLSPIEGKELVKNRTYTGRIVLDGVRPQSASETTIPVPPTALISVKVVQNDPDVKITFAPVDLYLNRIYGTEASGYYGYFGDRVVTVTGTNEEDVDSIEFSGVEGMNIECSGKDIFIIPTTAAAIKPQTIKPVVTVKFKPESGFADLVIAKDVKGVKKGTTSIKLVQNKPPLKLDKTSAKWMGNEGDSVSVNVLGPQDTYWFWWYSVQSMTALEKGTDGKWGESENVSVSLDNGNWDNPRIAITLTAKQKVTGTLKLRLKLTFGASSNELELPFTISVAPLSAKLGASTVSFNLKGATRTADVPLTVTPEGSTLRLTAVNGSAATDGTATVDGIVFTCNNQANVAVDVSAATLVKGTKKYSLTFDGIAKPLTLSVKVEDKYQTAKLKKTSVTLNTTLVKKDGTPGDYALVPLVYSDGIVPAANVELTPSSSEVSATYDEQTGNVEVRMYPGAPKSVTVQVKLADSADTKLNLDPKKSTVKLTVKKNDKPVVLVAKFKDKLDTTNLNKKVYMDITLKGSAYSVDFTDTGNVIRDLIFDDHPVLRWSSWGDDDNNGKFMTVAWKPNANVTYGAGKYEIMLTATNQSIGMAAKPAKPIVITAQQSKPAVTAQTITLYQTAWAQRIPLHINTAGADSDALVTGITLAKQSDVYALERTSNGYSIRYKSATPFGTKKWKATDSIKLNVTMSGSGKVYTVTVPIVNMQVQK